MEKMKVAITGHTSGIGKALYDYYPNHIGFSRSNGFNINNIDDINKMIGCDFDVFINNAYDENGQIKVLEKWFNRYKNSDKSIIVMGSRASGVCEYRQKSHLYSVYKKALESYTKQLQNTERKCKIYLLSPGFVEKNPPFLKYSDIISTVDFMLTSTFEIREIICSAYV